MMTTWMPIVAWWHVKQGECTDLGQVTPHQSETWKTRSAPPRKFSRPFVDNVYCVNTVWCAVMCTGKPHGLRTARKLRNHRRDQKWHDKDYKKSHLGTRWKSNPFGGASHAKGIVLEKVYVFFSRLCHYFAQCKCVWEHCVLYVCSRL